MTHRNIPEYMRAHARSLRTNMTDAERKFWQIVRAKRFHGLVFRRQVPIGAYIVDFICHQKGLIVELDGSQHYEDEALRADANRDAWLESQRYTVVRYSNRDVLTNLDGVLLDLSYRTGVADHPPPGACAPTSPSRGEGCTSNGQGDVVVGGFRRPS